LIFFSVLSKVNFIWEITGVNFLILTWCKSTFLAVRWFQLIKLHFWWRRWRRWRFLIICIRCYRFLIIFYRLATFLTFWLRFTLSGLFRTIIRDRCRRFRFVLLRRRYLHRSHLHLRGGGRFILSRCCFFLISRFFIWTCWRTRWSQHFCLCFLIFGRHCCWKQWKQYIVFFWYVDHKKNKSCLIFFK